MAHAGSSIVLLAISSLIAPPPALVWNASASAPVGLYRIETRTAPAFGDLLALRAPERIARSVASRSCRKLVDDEVFLVNAGVPDKIDGRCFIPQNEIW